MMRKKVGTVMLIRNARRFTYEAMGNIFKNGLMSLASLFIIVACLFVFGVFLVVTVNINFFGDQVADQCQIQVYITQEASDGGKIQSISNSIRAMEGISNITFERGEETFAKFKAGLTEEELVSYSGLPDDIIDDSFKVTLHDISETKEKADAISKIDGVLRVENRQDMINIVYSITNAIRHISVWIIIIFMFISVFIISNTIKLAVYARRKEINIMKYVGATDAFIRWPFMIEGMIVGFAGAIIAFFIVQSCYVAGLSALGSIPAGAIVALRNFGDIWHIILLPFIGVGVSIGALGSALSMRKYLQV